MLPEIGVIFALTASAVLDCKPAVAPILRDGLPYVREHFADSWRDLSKDNAKKALERLTKPTSRERREDHIRPVVYALYVLAYSLRSDSKFEDARSFVSAALELQASLPTLNWDDRARRAEMFLSLGLTEQFFGDYTASADAYQQSADIAMALPAEIFGPGKAAMLGTAYVYKASLEYDRRRYSIAESLVIEAKKLSATPLVSTWGDIILASVYRQQGDFAEAENLFKTAAASSRAACMPELLALSHRSLGEMAIYYRPKAYEDDSVRLMEAITHLERSELLYQDLGRDLEIGITLGHIGEAHAKLGKLSQAKKDFESAYEVFESSGFIEEVGRMRHHLGTLLLRIAETEKSPTATAKVTDEAIQNFDSALEIYTKLDDSEWQWRSHLGRGIAYQGIDEVQAMRDFQAATEILVAMRSSLALHTLGGGSEFQESYREPFDRLTAMLVKQDRLEEAREIIAQSDSISLRNNFMIGAALGSTKETGTRSDSSCSQLLFAYSSLQQRSTLTNFAHSNNPNESLSKKSMAKQIDLVLSDISQAASIAVPDHAALVTYRLLPDSILILATTNKTNTTNYKGKFEKVIQVPSKEIKNKVIRFLRTIDRSRVDPTGGGWTANSRNTGRYNERLITISNELYAWLISPLHKFLKSEGVRTLILAPDDIIKLIPFAALAQTQSNGRPRFLIEDFTIRRFSGRTTPIPTRKVRKDSDVVAFVNPEQRNNARAALPYSSDLARKSLRPKFDARIYSGGAATKNNLRLEWNKASLLHIGAHGVVTTDSPFLLLAPDEVQGRLPTCEILDLPRRSDLDLVVLEACESAVPVNFKNTSAESNLRSLRYAFSARGAQSVIATLWRVGESSSSSMMQRFYDLIHKGASIQDALRNAQLSMLQYEDTYAQPYYWASFVLFQSEKINAQR